MDLFDLVKSLVPSLEKSRILEDISITQDELQTQTYPAFQSTVGAKPFNNGFKDRWCAQFQKDWNSKITLRQRPDNYIDAIYIILETLPARLEWLRKEVQTNFSDDLVAKGITFPKANILGLLQAIGFAVKYSRKLLLATYGYELPHVKNLSAKTAFSKAELKLLDDQAASFIRVMAILSRQDVTAQIDRVPEVVVETSSDSGAADLHGHNLDPLTLGFLPYRWNPIYHIRLKISEWQHSRYESAKAERQAIELRLLLLKQSQTGSKDPSVEKQIAYYDDLVKDLNYKISKMEE